MAGELPAPEILSKKVFKTLKVFKVVRCEGVVRTGAVFKTCAQQIENSLSGKALFARSRPSV